MAAGAKAIELHLEPIDVGMTRCDYPLNPPAMTFDILTTSKIPSRQKIHIEFAAFLAAAGGDG
jgi:hypothetical protein